MLIAAFIALYALFGGDVGFDQVFRDLDKGLVREHVGSEETREQLFAASEELAVALEANRERLAKHIESFMELQMDREARREAYAQLNGDISALLEERAGAALETRRKMHSMLTREEWNGVFATQ